MKIIVPLKRIPDPDQKIKIQHNQPDWSESTWIINQFDEYALEAALRLTEDAANPANRLGEVVVVSIGPSEVQQQLRTALAMGADRAIHIMGEEKDLDGAKVAYVLKELVKKESPDLVLMGKLAADGEGNEVGQRLAGLLGWPQATFASSMVRQENGKTFQVEREVDAGTEVKKVTLPAVITVDLRIIAPKAVQNGVTAAAFAYPEGARYPSLKAIMTAKKKSIDVSELSAIGGSAGPYVKVIHAELPPPRKTGIKVNSVAELVEKLHNEARVI